MRAYRRMIAVLGLVSASTPVFAAGVAQPQFAQVNGTCLKVSIGTQDMTKACSGILGRSLHADGRTGIYFFLGENHIVTFSGTLSTDRKRDAQEVDTIKVDEMLLNDGRSKDPQRVAAKGRCTTSRQTETTFIVSCSGSLRQGTAFAASFQIEKSK
ncbi:hypothetical protein [Rhizobium paknamense]|uniref:Uncharacterized protein n=1 Tax=Rhizobium paknamense TaxID=1206817 RepID=A0ABU0I920_9HYPH|nr:hypothetical protein [Rhizobium paknamense]MDQ0454738.1 hypothetical protein [Rhizobium paknamense]